MADGGWNGSPGTGERAPYPGREPYEPEGSSLPWQDRQHHPSFLGALWATVKVVLSEPSRAFSHIKVEGSLSGSMLYVVILGSLSGYVGLMFQLLLQSVGLTLGAAAKGEPAMVAAVGGMAVFSVVAAIFIPIMVLVGSFVGAAVLHVFLWIVGGARRSFEATYAVAAYCGGSTGLLGLIPMCGGLIGAVWNIVVEVIGLREVHGTTTGKAVLAVLLPMIVCCGLGIVLWVAFIGALVAAGVAAQ
jgi:hypothetical protein